MSVERGARSAGGRRAFSQTPSAPTPGHAAGDPPRAARSTLHAVRLLALALLALSALLPFALLAVWSVSRAWFYPALWPASLTAESWRALVGGAGGSVGRSVLVAALTATLGCAVALPIGRALAALAGWRRHLGAALVFLPVAAPPIALGTGLQYAFLRAGLGGTMAGVVLAHLVPAAGYLALYFLGVFTAFDARAEEEARSLGASRWQVLARVTLPLLRRPLGEAFALGFLVSWSQVALTLLIGGGKVRTLPLELFGYLRSGQERYAAAGALLLSVPPLLALAAARLAAGRTAVAAP